MFAVAATVGHRQFRVRSLCMIISVSTGRKPSFVLMDRIHRFLSSLQDDAVAAFRFFGLDTHAELIERADAEYARCRPRGFVDPSSADEALWEELDTAYFATATDASIEAALHRFPGLRP
ncbi:hypothetical protein [Arthrobacter sp. AQ5-05]|uniref:DMP19 family protein n=1 Tax=Arthrobacter sp. AQ5-05 TaxID=2184581 RepID=UPI0011BED073|nr:hypothetical protein [Arthrobacter sp. AQ5-05]